MNTAKKILTLAKLISIIEQLKKEGKIICHCHGVFDVLHIGHHRHFKMAKEIGDVLVVTLSPDRFVDKGNGRPIFSQELRLEQIADLEFVDFVALNETPTAVEIILQIKPNFFCKGEEFAGGKDDVAKIGAIQKEKDAVESVGGKIYYTPTGMSNVSSTKIANAHLGIFSKQQKDFLEQLKKNFNLQQILNFFEDFKKLKVLLVGESIFDKYVYVMPLGKSPKDNNLSVNPIREELFGGGIISCANMIANLCENVSMMSAIGDNDLDKAWLQKQLNTNIHYLLFSDSKDTAIKRSRFLDVSYEHKLFETIDLPEQKNISEKVEQKILECLCQILEQYDLVIAMDYGYNLMTDKIRALLMEKSKFLSISAETNPYNIGFNLLTSKYQQANFVCLGEQEIRLTTHDMNSNMPVVIEKLLANINCKQLVVTLGHKGLIACDRNKLIEIPAFSKKVLDTTGADDVCFSVSALCAKINTPAIITGFIGNIAGALAVEIMGSHKNIPALSIRKSIKTLMQ